MKLFALIVAALLVLSSSAEAGPVRAAGRLALRAGKVVKVVRVARAPLRVAKAVLPPWR